jgi:hypothetical protein
MSYFPKITKDKKPILFIHIPKTAGTSVLRWYEKTYGKKFVKEHHHAPRRFNKFLDYNYKSFSIVRNPYDRAFSFYKFRKQVIKHQQEDISDFQNELNAWNKGFDYWVKNYFHYDWPLPKRKKPIYKINGFGFNPTDTQYDYLTINNKISVDFILNFENLSNDFFLIKDYVNSNVDLPVENVTNGNWDNYRKYYTEESKKIITKYYEKDLDYFKYVF